jgi:hypothetical protein
MPTERHTYIEIVVIRSRITRVYINGLDRRVSAANIEVVKQNASGLQLLANINPPARIALRQDGIIEVLIIPPE